ncbi:SPOSA6832_04267, partial [Sporobolomyces salmonicolor]
MPPIPRFDYHPFPYTTMHPSISPPSRPYSRSHRFRLPGHISRTFAIHGRQRRRNADRLSQFLAGDCPNGAAPKKCYSCGDSGHISRECPQNPNAGAGAGFGGPVGGFGGGAAGVCYRCGQPGHISRACPQNAGFGAAGAFGAGAGAGAGGYGYGGFGAPKTCYTCGGVGHLSRECVNPSKCFVCLIPWLYLFPSRERNLTSFGISQNCGQVGHISRDCSNAPQQKSCYNCGEAGHISRECPQAAGAGAAAPQA